MRKLLLSLSLFTLCVHAEETKKAASNSKKVHDALRSVRKKAVNTGNGTIILSDNPPAVFSKEMTPADLEKLMKAAKKVSGETERGLQGKAVTTILQDAGFTKTSIQIPYARDLGAELLKMENGFEKLFEEKEGWDGLDLDQAPAGSVIVMKGGSAGSVYIKGNDGKYYSDGVYTADGVKAQLSRGRTITGIYYKKAGSRGTVPAE